jgi:hypothetical protein
MKKQVTTRTIPARKLVLRRETIVALTSTQLWDVVGGFIEDPGSGPGCTLKSREQGHGCDD